MPLIKQHKRMVEELAHYSTKWDSLFKSTHFDRIVSKQLQNPQNNITLDQSVSTGMIKSYMIAHVKNVDSQRNVVKFLTDEEKWLKITGFEKEIPVQSTFSRHWNNDQYVDALDSIFTNLQELIGHKKIHLQYELPRHICNFLAKGWLPLSADATFTSLPNNKFDYATYGYSGAEGKTAMGAKVNMIIDTILNMPMNYIPTSGNVHEARSVDPLIDDLIENSHPWLKKLGKGTLKPLIAIDKGYWNKERFFDWTRNQIGFIIPRKRKSFTGNLLEFLEFPVSKYEPMEALVWGSNTDEPLRWIIYKNYSKEFRYWDLITNVFDVTKQTIIEGIKERWPIEEFFKSTKQNFDLGKPLAQSWTGYVIHCFIIFILFMLIQFFLSLLAVPKWQDNVNELCRQLKDSPFACWSFHRLRIPLGYLNGVEE